MAALAGNRAVVAHILWLLASVHTGGANMYKDIETKMNDSNAFDLWVVGTYIAAHKYFGVDYRYQAGDPEPEDQVFYRKFPSPALKQLHPDLESVCYSNFIACIYKIRNVARKSGTLQHLIGNEVKIASDTSLPVSVPLYYPFESNFDMFKFRQTAMYYLCYHTLNGRIHYENTKVSCLEYLNIVEEIPEKTREELVKSRRPIIKDIREKTYKSDPTLCPMLWFCPDPCYGRMDRGNFERADYKVKGNPCLELKNSKCEWSKTAVSFDDVIKNKFPIVCDCESERKGFHWNNQFEMCVDTDECYTNSFNCPNDRVCMNSVGSYICTCPKGYDVDPKTDTCQRTSLIHEAAVVLESNPAFYLKPEKDKPKDDTVGLLSELLQFVGLSGTPPLGGSDVMIFIIVFLVQLLFI